MGTANRYLRNYRSHYDPWLTQIIHEKRLLLEFPTDANQIAIGLNSTQYQGSDESFGICPLPTDVMEKLCIEKCTFIVKLTRKNKK